MKDHVRNKLVNESLSKMYQLTKHKDHHKLISFKAKAILGMTPPRCRQVRALVFLHEETRLLAYSSGKNYLIFKLDLFYEQK
jgi:hypothetical protein